MKEKEPKTSAWSAENDGWGGLGRGISPRILEARFGLDPDAAIETCDILYALAESLISHGARCQTPSSTSE